MSERQMAPGVIPVARELAAQRTVQAAADGRDPGEFFDQLAGQNTGRAAGLR